jgi:hypothetical protein
MIQRIKAAYLSLQAVQRYKNAQPWWTEERAQIEVHPDEAALLEAEFGPADGDGVYGGMAT